MGCSVGQPCRHLKTGEVSSWTERAHRLGITGNTEVEDLNDRVVAVKGDVTCVDVGVVVCRGGAVDVGLNSGVGVGVVVV